METETDVLAELLRLTNLIEEKKSELALVRAQRAELKDQLIHKLPSDIERTKLPRAKAFGRKEQLLIEEIAKHNRRVRELKAPQKGPDYPKPRDGGTFSVVFYKVAEEFLDSRLLDELRKITFARIQAKNEERKPQPGDAQSFANAQFVR